MRYRLVAVDLTGTLLEPGGHLDPRPVDLMGRAQDLSVRFAFATGLPPLGAAAVARRTDIAAFLVGYSGAVLQTPGDRDTIAHTPLHRDTALAVLRAAAGRRLARAAGYPDRVLADTSDLDGKPLSDWLLNTPRVVDLDAAVAQHPDSPAAVMVFGDPRELDVLGAELAADAPLGGRIAVLGISDGAMEVVAAGVSKGRALRDLGARLGVPRAEILAIGDSAADRDLLAAAGLGCAVGNAAPALKAVADYVANAPMGAGVAEIVERFVLGSG